MAKIVFNTDIVVKGGTIGYTDPQPTNPPQSLRREQPKPDRPEEGESPEQLIAN